MKMRKILATLAAAVVACSAMVSTAFAATKDLEVTGTAITMIDGGVRINVYNPWANGNTECMAISDLKGLVGATQIDVTVKVTGADKLGAFKMYINGMTNDAENDINVWAGSKPVNCTADEVSVDKDGEYVVSIKMADGKAWSNDKDSFLAVYTDIDQDKWAALGEDGKSGDPKTLEITKITVTTADAPAAGGEESKTDSTTDSTASSSTAPATDKNEPTGATAGLALAGLAIAGAAVVASKKSK